MHLFEQVVVFFEFGFHFGTTVLLFLIVEAFEHFDYTDLFRVEFVCFFEQFDGAVVERDGLVDQSVVAFDVVDVEFLGFLNEGVTFAGFHDTGVHIADVVVRIYFGSFEEG